MTTVLIAHPAFINHDTGPEHPEQAARIRCIDRALENEAFQMLIRHEAPLRDDDETYIAKAHSRAHIDLMSSYTRGTKSGRRYIDGDTVVSPGTWEAVRRGIGAGLDAVDLVMKDEATNVFCKVRPPGHHAETDRAMGFCIFNNVAVAAHYAREKYGLDRVAVVDWDVHHGNGTQEIFWSDKNLFYGSTHQMPLFPGTGAVSEAGVGNIFNAPLRAGDDRLHFEEAFRERILVPLHNFSPDLILISAGFDAHRYDPLGGLGLVEADYEWATRELAIMARRHCRGRMVSMLEGGYNLTALAQSVAAHVRTLMEASV
jgi:acetoin utilization deacetylase AcuC-like enzyme